MDQISYWIKAD